MFKKLITVALMSAMVLTMAFTTGCGKKDSSSDSSTLASATDSTGESTADKAPNKVKVGFIFIGNIKDGGWTQAHYNGLLEMKKNLGLSDSDVLYRENVKEEKAACKDAITQLINEGCNVIFTTSFGFMDATIEVAKEHKDIKFMHCSGYQTADNVGTYFGRMYEARYLSGIVAGLKTKTNKIGFIGAVQLPEVISGIDAFTLGVQSVNKDAVVKVLWLGNWGDPAKEKELATALLNDGCDVITQHSDSPGPQIAAEAKKVFAIGYDLDNRTAAPKAYLTAPIWNWGSYYTEQVKAVQEGTWKSDAYKGGIKEGILDIAKLSDIAPEGAQAKVDEVKAKIVDGTFEVFKGPITAQDGSIKIKDGEAWGYDDVMGKMNWLVKGVDGKIDSK